MLQSEFELIYPILFFRNRRDHLSKAKDEVFSSQPSFSSVFVSSLDRPFGIATLTLINSGAMPHKCLTIPANFSLSKVSEAVNYSL